MSDDTFRKVGNHFKETLSNGKYDLVYFRIAGGEPLLEFKKLRSEIESLMDDIPTSKVHVEILTNLTFLPDGFNEFLIQYKPYLGLCVSLDSMKYSKPYLNGESSHKDVLENIKAVKDIGIPISISTVITDSASHLPKLAEYVVHNGFNLWDMSFNKHEILLGKEQEVKENIKSFVDILEKADYSFFDVRFNGISFTENTGCGSGINLICVDTNGDVYPCQTLLESKSELLGNLIKGQYGTYNDKTPGSDCKECSIFYYCAGECKYHNTDKRKETFCDIAKLYVSLAGEKILKGAKGA